MKSKKYQSQKGQALIFVIGTMAIALAVGIGVAVRNLSSISRSSRSDTATRAQAAAEAGVENFLTKTDEELYTYVGNTVGETVTLPTVEQDNINTKYTVTVDTYGNVDSPDYSTLTVSKNETGQVLLDGNDDVMVCWTSTDPENNSDLFITAYSENAEDKDDITNVGVYSEVSSNNFEASDGSNENFEYCYNDVPLPSNPDVLRIKSLKAGSNIGVYPKSGSLPDQGFEIISVGQLLSASETTEDVESKVVVRRSFSYLPGFFDFAVYSGEGL